MTRMLERAEFQNVSLIPPEFKLTDPVVAGLAFPSEFPDFARHRRSGYVADTDCDMFPEGAKKLTGKYVYGGFVLHHFGHLIAECINRLWVCSQSEYKDLPVLFLMAPENSAMTRYLAEIAEYFGISNYQIETEPVVVDSLVIGEMGKEMRRESHESYNEWLGDIAADRLQDSSMPEKIFVLRGHFPAGKVIGETALGPILEGAGYFCLRPEEYPILQQLKYYANAKKIIFSEGSAIHLCDLLPRLEADVAVLNRRPLSVLAETSLRNKARRLFILDDCVRVLSPRSKTNVGFNRALSYFPLDQIQQILIRHQFVEAAHWPSGWHKRVSLTDAFQFLNSIPQDDGHDELSLDDAGEVVTLLMDEVRVHFGLLRKARYKLFMVRAYQAFDTGRYDDAIDFTKRALSQYHYSKEAKELLQKAERKKLSTSSFWGQLWDKFSRFKVIFTGIPVCAEIQIPEKETY